MQFPYHALIGLALNITVSPPTPVFTYSPVVLPIQNRPVDLQVRVSAPPKGEELPVIVLSHGLGSYYWDNSLDGYSSLSDFFAGHGFVVIQPTHLNSAFLGLSHTPPGQELWWQSMAQDLVHVVDRLDEIEATVPTLAGRMDHSKIAVVGHSFGATAACLVMGMTNTDPRDNSTVYMLDKRIKAGVVMSSGGNGGDALTKSGAAVIPWYGPDFSTMTVPGLVVYGDKDESPESTNQGAIWHADPYFHSPGPKDLFSVKGGLHELGGVSGWDAAGTEDESPQRLEAVRRMTWAYLRSQLYPEDQAWEKATTALQELEALGSTKSKTK
jgi:pimeloyl-ACP methyl ester carboxylesterase